MDAPSISQTTIMHHSSTCSLAWLAIKPSKVITNASFLWHPVTHMYTSSSIFSHQAKFRWLAKCLSVYYKVKCWNCYSKGAACSCHSTLHLGVQKILYCWSYAECGHYGTQSWSTSSRTSNCTCLPLLPRICLWELKYPLKYPMVTMRIISFQTSVCGIIMRVLSS